MRFALAVTGNPAQAADAVQDAMLAVFPRWHRLAEPGAADAYARRVIVNHRISWWRRIGRREASLDSAGPAAAPEHDLGDVILAERLLRTLPARQRAAVVLRYLDDLDFAQIGTILGCPESTARSHVHRALRRLRELVGEDHDR